MISRASTDSSTPIEHPSEDRHLPLKLGLTLVAIAIVGSVQAGIADVRGQRPPFFDEQRFELWATNLSDHGYYGDLPSQFPAIAEFRSVGYSAYVPPGYPFFLIALRGLGGSGSAPIRRGQSILVGLTILAAGYTAFRLFGPLAAVLAEALLVLTGVLATYAQFTLSEILSAATLVGCILLLVIGIQRRSLRWLAGAGVLLGYSSLVRPQVYLLPIPIGLFLFLIMGRRKTALVLAAVFLIASYATIAPWTIRNELRLHAFVPVSTYTWINFWLVNNPGADGSFRRPEYYIGVRQVRAIRSLPEVQQDIEWRRMALAWVRAHPGTAAKGWIRNERRFVSDPDPLIQRWYGVAGTHPPRLDERYLLPFAIMTLIVTAFARKAWPSAGILAIVLVYFLAFFAFFLPTPRFRVPMIPVIAILAAGLPEAALALKRPATRQTESAA